MKKLLEITGSMERLKALCWSLSLKGIPFRVYASASFLAIHVDKNNQNFLQTLEGNFTDLEWNYID